MIPLPAEFMEMIEKMLGDEAPAFFASLEENAALALRVNPAKKAALDAAAPFSEAGVPWEK